MMKQATINYSDSSTEFQIPLSGDLARLLALESLEELKVHGLKLLFDKEKVTQFLGTENSAITTKEELETLLESKLSPEDAKKICDKQTSARIAGQSFTVTEVGDFVLAPTSSLTLVVPEVKIDTKIIELAIDSLQKSELSEFIPLAPIESEDEEPRTVKCLSGEQTRYILNEMQTESGGLDMDSQLKFYFGILTSMPDDDPTKMLVLTNLRYAMQYADVVSNKALRLAMTKVVMTGE